MRIRMTPQHRERDEQPELQMKIKSDLIPWVGGEFDAASLHLRQQIFKERGRLQRVTQRRKQWPAHVEANKRKGRVMLQELGDFLKFKKREENNDRVKTVRRKTTKLEQSLRNISNTQNKPFKNARRNSLGSTASPRPWWSSREWCHTRPPSLPCLVGGLETTAQNSEQESSEIGRSLSWSHRWWWWVRYRGEWWQRSRSQTHQTLQILDHVGCGVVFDGVWGWLD